MTTATTRHKSLDVRVSAFFTKPHLDYRLDLPGVKVETCTQIEGQIYFRLSVLASRIVCHHCENYTEELHQNLAEFWAIARSDITIARLMVGKRHCGVLISGNG
jgi:hypothetical protein